MCAREIVNLRFFSEEIFYVLYYTKEIKNLLKNYLIYKLINLITVKLVQIVFILGSYIIFGTTADF